MIVADADFAGILAVRFDGGELAARGLGEAPTPRAFDRALACR
jgi:hypothetical protein